MKGLTANLVLLCLFKKKIDKQNTSAILEIFDPNVFPIAKAVSFNKADSMDINISGADVAMPIKKKLAKKPDILYLLDMLSVAQNLLLPIARIGLLSNLRLDKLSYFHPNKIFEKLFTDFTRAFWMELTSNKIVFF